MVSGGMGLAADATRPVDLTDRNVPFAPSGSIAPATKKPAVNDTLQEKRIEKATIEKQPFPSADRRAPIELTEAQPKNVREKESRRPEKLEQPTSAFNHRPAGISTAGDTVKPPTVARYQDSLTAASATNMARFPAIDRAATAKINRFVFRKNPSEATAVTAGTPVVPAAGGSSLSK